MARSEELGRVAETLLQVHHFPLETATSALACGPFGLLKVSITQGSFPLALQCPLSPERH